MTAPDLKVGRLKNRPEFLAVAGARRKHVAPGLILQVRRHDERQRPAPGEPLLRVGLTASRKVGNAVKRNRARRRLREAARLLLPPNALPGFDLVLVARGETPNRPWADLLADMTAGLKRLGVWRMDADPATDPATETRPTEPRP